MAGTSEEAQAVVGGRTRAGRSRRARGAGATDPRCLTRATAVAAYPRAVDPTLAVWLAAAALAVALVGVVLALLALRRQVRTARRLTVLWGDGPAEEATTVLARLAQRVATQRARTDEVETALTALRADLGQVLQHVAVVRYDAFGDMGGRMSFSAAIIDDQGDGMVLSSIHARGESRTYAKGVVGGRSDVILTPEEQQALAAARGSD